MAKQKLGQHFLKDQKKAEKIVEAVLRREGPVLEIGPGTGALTDILDRKGEGRQIVSVEKAPALIPTLQRKGYHNTKILSADILKTDPVELFGKMPVNLLGSIPYLISKEIIDWIIRYSGILSSGVLMVQKEFFLKVTSIPGSKLYNAQSVMFGTLFDTEKLFDVPPGSFYPPPKVTSTVFTFTKPVLRSPGGTERGQVLFKNNLHDFYQFLKTAFRHRRKTLPNNLGKEFNKSSILQSLESESIPPDIRSEDMAPEDLRKLFLKLLPPV